MCISSTPCDGYTDRLGIAYGRFRRWESILARIELFGFAVGDLTDEVVQVKRSGRTSSLCFADGIHIDARDPRDAWLLQQAVYSGEISDRCATYFIYRPADGQLAPVQVRLSQESTAITFEHDMMDGRIERTAISNFDALDDSMPFLAPPNSIGYHRAREAMINLYQRIRRVSWSEAGVSDPEAIADYELHAVTANDVALGASLGIHDPIEIIRRYGIPPSDGWVDRSVDHQVG